MASGTETARGGDPARVDACEAVMGTVRAHAITVLGRSGPSNLRNTEGTTGSGSAGSACSEWGGNVASHWKEEQWRTALEELFYKGPKGNEKSLMQDDMVFYVLAKQSKKKKKKKKFGNDDEDGDGVSVDVEDDEASSREVTVRRWTGASSLVRSASDIQGLNKGMDLKWMESLFLNILMHTTYTLTVAICNKQSLLAKQNQKQNRGNASSQLASAPPVFKTSRKVYASHMRLSVVMDPQKKGSGKGASFSGEEKMNVSYPEIFFAVDDFEEAFDEVVVRDDQHCLCVLLYATDGPSFASSVQGAASSDGEGKGEGKQESQKRRVPLFSGYVPYDQLADAVRHQHNRYLSASLGSFGSLFGDKKQHLKSEKIFMRGPGGIGHAEVAVTTLPEQGVEQVDADTEAGKGFLGFFTGSSTSSTSTKKQPSPSLRCCLMNVSLHWKALAHDILKGSG
mmetsp:Transcript_6767/g.17243  ORF Transcript_6767/g.17243 Transcript_6767/m.17243 type:complete len:453 (-) Transcript_6767:725-2083(-)